MRGGRLPSYMKYITTYYTSYPRDSQEFGIAPSSVRSLRFAPEHLDLTSSINSIPVGPKRKFRPCVLHRLEENTSHRRPKLLGKASKQVPGSCGLDIRLPTPSYWYAWTGLSERTT